MKKTLLLLASAALLLVGCAKEQIAEKNVGGEGLQTVSFTVGVESAATKAVADEDGAAANINHWVMQVFDSDGEVYNYQEDTENAPGGRTHTFSVPLVKGQTYNVLFWADTKGSYVVSNLKNVTRATTVALTANRDDLDAFSAVVNDFTTTTATQQNITLKRPFAQMNVVFTDLKKLYETMGNDTEYAKFIPTNFVAKAKIPTTFNVLTQKAGALAETALEMGAATNYKDNYAAHNAKATLYMDYILASADDKDIVDIDFSFTSKGVEIKHEFAAIPFQRNYRTNIIGELMSAGATWNVVVDPQWTGENDINLEVVDNISALNQSLATGANDLTIKLPSDSDATKVTFTTTNDPQDVILNFVGALGNNKTLNFKNDTGASGPKSLNITAPAGTSLVFEDPQNHVVINGTSYTSVEGAFSANTLVISKNVTVGTLTITAGGLEIHGTVSAIGEGLTDNVKVRECEGLSDDVYNKLNDYIDTPQYKAVQKGETWDIVAADKVAMIGEAAYYSLETALNAAQSGNEIKLLVDLENIGRPNIPAGVTFNGCGHKITGESSLYFNSNGGAIKNVVFKDIKNTANKMSAVYAYNLVAKAEISGCTFENCDWDAIQITPNDANADIVIKDNEFKAIENQPEQKRFIHIQSSNAIAMTVDITGNKLEGMGNLAMAAIEVYYPADFSKVNISGNSVDGSKASVCILGKDDNDSVNRYDVAKKWLDANGQPVTFNAAIGADVKVSDVLLCTTLAVALQESWTGNLCILNEAALRELSTIVNGGTSFSGKIVSLVNDIDLRNVPFTPIGNVSSYPSVSFAGTFDGMNHTISNLKCSDNTPDHACAGLFGSISGDNNSDNSGTVKNLTLNNVDITSNHYAGGIVAYCSASPLVIENCNIIGGTITSSPELIGEGYDNGDKVGGILGYAGQGGVITNCSVQDLTIKAYRDVGGIVGYNRTNISDCSVKNCVIIQDNTNAYKDYEITTFGEIVGNQDSGELLNNSTDNVTVQSLIADGLVYTKNLKLYEISKVAGLTHFRDMVTGGKDFAGETVKLLENINLASIDNYLGTKDKFSGTFDGNGKTISNLKISGEANSTAFFGSVWNAKIKDLNITGANVTSTGTDYTGILAGNGYANIENCTVSGTVSGVEQVGAVIGYLSCGSIKSCKVNAAVSGTSRVGVLCAKANVDSSYKIEDNTIKGSATSNDIYAGGVVGQIMCATGNTWTIKNNSIDATVSTGGSLIGNVRNGNWEAFAAGYQTNVTGNTWTADGNCKITDGNTNHSVEISK